MRFSPARSPAKPPTRWKRVLLVTLIVAVPRCTSRSRNVRALRSTDTIVPSNWRVAARGAGGLVAGRGGAPGRGGGGAGAGGGRGRRGGRGGRAGRDGGGADRGERCGDDGDLPDSHHTLLGGLASGVRAECRRPPQAPPSRLPGIAQARVRKWFRAPEGGALAWRG